MSTPPIVDLRSDTVTRPSARMRRAMAEAEVGDDVYGEDPTVRALEDRAAALLGFEASLFVPTGTMGNQIAIHLHARPGSEVIVEEGSHVYNWELGAMAAWSGALPRVVRGERGLVDPEQVALAIAPPVYYRAPTSLLVLENTHNQAGGTVLPLERKEALLAVARRHGLRVHLDGARIFNAAAALGVPARELAAGFDTVMFCLSKGLGAPVGSMLCASRERIAEARVVRKRMGGGMRQAGVLAAAGMIALEDNRERLGEDHRRARRLAEGIAARGWLGADPAAVATNMVMADVPPPATVEEALRGLAGQGVLAGSIAPGRIRFVTHLDVDDAAIERAIAALRAIERA
jgi:threonine aldolase